MHSNKMRKKLGPGGSCILLFSLFTNQFWNCSDLFEKILKSKMADIIFVCCGIMIDTWLSLKYSKQKFSLDALYTV